MAKATWTQVNFNGGEWSPLAQGRIDIDKYSNGLDLCQRFVPAQQGCLVRCPGTRWVAEAKHHTYDARLQRFEFSTTQAYMLEFGHQYVRFYLNDGQLLDAGAPYEVATPYTLDDIWDLDFAQNADTLYVAHKNHPTRKLQRWGATNWTLTEVSFLDGPYLPLNLTTTTLSPAAVTGITTVTASAVTGINGGAGFQASDVGRSLRIKCGAVWVWGRITAYTDATHVQWTIVPGSGSPTTGATKDWRLGLWNSTDGYPSCVTFHQDRLFLAGSPAHPSRLDGSYVGDYENFAPSVEAGTVTDAHAIGTSLNAGTVNTIQWMASDEWGLMAGTAGNEWVVSPGNTQTALTYANINQKALSLYGSSRVAPVKVGKATLFVQRTQRKLRELFYHFTYNTFQAVDLTLLGEHLTSGGIKQMAVQLAPQQLVWVCRKDGKFVALTYDKDQEVVGWHQHPLGGYSDAGKTVGALVGSVGSIPAPGITRDEVWVLVTRHINGATKRYVEVFTKFWEDGDAIEDAVFLDSSAEYRGAPTTTISGLMWLVGETVGVLADGAVHPDCVVSAAGTITLQSAASVVQVGLKYKSAGRTLNPEVGGTSGPSQGKFRRVISTVFRFFQSIGFKLGTVNPGVTAAVYPLPTRTSNDPMGSPPSLVSGDQRYPYEARFDRDGKIYFETDYPTPCNITLLSAIVDVKDEE